MTRWTIRDMPRIEGRRAVVTGPGGLGFETALALAQAGASVIVAGRDPGKGHAAVASIRAAVPEAAVSFGHLDLADLASVARFAAELEQALDGLDILVNNAGVMTPPARRETRDGFEMQFGTNHLGHFALTGRLLALLSRGTAPRVVSVSSIAARQGRIDLDDLQATRRYNAMASYCQSKLACLMFALDLSRRSRVAGWGIASLAAHPGIARSDLLVNGPGAASTPGRIRRFLPFLFQPVAQGALPQVFAATDPAAQDGRYYGPDRLGGVRGHPRQETPPKAALDAAVAARLWAVSADLTGVSYP
jgi:NAD(P)-dependent dehydrogenase (short-subunit alcohol dehydrogenase family)